MIWVLIERWPLEGTRTAICAPTLPKLVFSCLQHCKSKGRPKAVIYFGCALRVIGAPMPSTFEASTFAAKFYWVDKVVKEEKGPTDAHKDAVQRYLGEHVVWLLSGEMVAKYLWMSSLAFGELRMPMLCMWTSVI